MKDTSSESTSPESTPSQDPAAYDPPRIESIMTPDDLDREVLYAGRDISLIEVPG